MCSDSDQRGRRRTWHRGGHHHLAVSEGAELPAGDYDVTVSAVTGTGDGCPPADGSAEREATAETTITVT
ncbi:MAG: hypothetical protein M5U19_03170 [Microthrixaceae bacterium]|nr:hypothetical protein [Microthrixaceae bacterium]